MIHEDMLVQRAAHLARLNPEVWGLFMRALGDFSTNITYNCITSPLEELPRAQGRAQAIARIVDLLADCTLKAEKLEGRRK